MRRTKVKQADADSMTMRCLGQIHDLVKRSRRINSITRIKTLDFEVEIGLETDAYKIKVKPALYPSREVPGEYLTTAQVDLIDAVRNVMVISMTARSSTELIAVNALEAAIENLNETYNSNRQHEAYEAFKRYVETTEPKGKKR